MAHAFSSNYGINWWIIGSLSRVSNSAIYIYYFLMTDYILGISAFYHDSAACLIKDGKILCAAQEERFTRIKHDSSFPKNAIAFCLKYEGLKLKNIAYISFYDKPFLKFERILETYLAFAPKGFTSFAKSMPIWVKEKLFQKSLILKELRSIDGSDSDLSKKLLFSEHHLSHASSAFFPSPFNEAAVLTMDGVGEWTTTSLAVGKNNNLLVHKEIHFPHSLGLLYSAITYYTGFKVNSGEYKVMGLAPYGKPVYVDLIKDNLIDIKEDGSFHMDMSYFDYCTGLRMTNNKFDKLFGGPARKNESLITQKEMDIAASIQCITEEVVLKLARNISLETKQRNLCLAGGVALNCVVNGILLKENVFDNIWIQPAAGDAGGALGAALGAYYITLNNKRDASESSDCMFGSYLGPKFYENQIEEILKEKKANYLMLDDSELVKKVANDIASGKAIGWMRGRMEFGPRALGNRSILADPRSETMQKNLNLKVKFRESFRPFAPSILSEDLDEWFDLDVESPYMLLVSNVAKEKQVKIKQEDQNLFGIEKLNVKKSEVPAITHVDYSARIQTVHKKTNQIFHELISEFKKITGCPILVNTSFNIRGEPIVCTPEDAYNCFMGTDLDILVIDNFYLKKQDQIKELDFDYRNKYSLD